MRKQNAGWFEVGAMAAFIVLFLLAGYEAEAREEVAEVSIEERIALRIYEEERDACYKACFSDTECELCPE